MKSEAEIAVSGQAMPAADGKGREPAARSQRVITSAELLAGGREIHIRHADEVYTLRLTSKGKLILTK